jgi:hypothetical protein
MTAQAMPRHWSTRKLYRSLIKKRGAKDIKLVQFRDWLAVLVHSEKAASTLVAEFGADFKAICATPVSLLTTLPHVGEAVALKIMAAAQLLEQETPPEILSDAIPAPAEV